MMIGFSRALGFASALFCVLASFASHAAEPQYGQVIDLPNNTHAADPSVIEVDGVTYLYPTSSSTMIECWSSQDLDSWSYRGVVWGPAEPGAWNDGDLWAPDVFAHDGLFYLYYSANQKIGVAVADDPAGPFVDAYDHPFIGAGHGGVGFLAIDAHAFRDDDGALYLYATGYNPFSFLRVFPMSDPLTLAGGWVHLFGPEILGWEFVVTEGPWMLKHQGVYYLMYSGNGANLPFYAIGYATADAPLGPFEKYEGNPILSSDWERDFWGPGHNSVVSNADGELWMFYHTKIAPDVGWSRVLRKNRLDFTPGGLLWVDLGLGPPADNLDDDLDDDTDDDTDDAAADDDDDEPPGDDPLAGSGQADDDPASSEQADDGACCG